MRRDYQDFVDRRAEILSIGPDDEDAFRRYWQDHDMPFVGLADPAHDVADLYGQQVKIMKLGRLPAVLVVDRAGRIRYRHYGDSMGDIPANEEILSVLDQLNDEETTL